MCSQVTNCSQTFWATLRPSWIEGHGKHWINIIVMSFKVHSWSWKQQLTKQSHLKVHFMVFLELSLTSHDVPQQMAFSSAVT